MSTLSGLWNNFPFGGADSSGSAGVPLSSLLNPAFRVAGIVPLPGLGPSGDMYDEARQACNRMLASWNCSPLNIYTTQIANYPLSANKIQYSIGPGGDFDQPRPQKIAKIVLVLGADGDPGNVRVVPPMTQLDDEGWANVALQKVPNTYPVAFYFDGGYNSNGQASIYFWGQSLVGRSVDIYSWLALQSNFTSINDVVALPPGYEQAIVLNLAVQLSLLWPEQFKRSTQDWGRVRMMANEALGAIQGLNSTTPQRMQSDAAGLTIGGGSGLHFDWRTGQNR